MATTDEILAQKGDLTVHHYVTRKPMVSNNFDNETLAEAWERFDTEGRECWTSMDALVEAFDEVVAEEVGDV